MDKLLILSKTKFDNKSIDFSINQNQFLNLKTVGESSLSLKILNMFNILKLTSNLIFLGSNELFKKEVALSLFLKYFKAGLKGMHQMFFIELKVIGLGYKVYKYRRTFNSRVVCFKLGYSHVIKYMLPKNIHLIAGKRRILFYTNDYISLKYLYQHLFFLKKINVYKLKGLIDVKKTIILKQGKQQQR